MPVMRAGLFKYYFALLIALSFTSVSYAEDWSDNLYLNGYFTLDLTVADSDLIMVSSVGERRNYKQDKPSVKNSLVGGQLEYQFSDNLSIFGQGVAFYDEQGSATTDINWAYVSYDFGDDLKTRIGVFQTPFLQGTELRTVGYSRLWARSLTPGAGASGINEYAGVDVVKQLAVGDYNWEFQFALGEGDHDLSEIDVDGVELLSAKVRHEQFWLRASVMHAQYKVDTPRGQTILESGDVVMASLETELTVGQTIINAGYSTSDSEVTPNDTMHYLSVAYRFDDVTPFIMLAKRNQYFEAFEVPLPPTGGNNPPPPPPGNQGPPNSAGPPSPPDGDADRYTLGVGARWNFAEQLALKVQYENVRISDNTGRLNSTGTVEGNVLTLAVEGAF